MILRKISKIPLKNPKEVMQAFLNGNKLQNSCYNDDSGEFYRVENYQETTSQERGRTANRQGSQFFVYQ